MKRWILAIAILLPVVIWQLFGSHIAFLLMTRNSHDTPIVVGTIPAFQPHGEWFRCRTESMEFAIPREIEKMQGLKAMGVGRYLTFGTGHDEMIVEMPSDRSKDDSELRKLLGAPRETLGLKLKFDLLKASTNDFRWTASTTDLKDLRSKLMLKTFLVGTNIREARYEETGDLEKLVYFQDKLALFAWRKPSTHIGGQMTFAGDDTPEKRAWVTQVCASFRVNAPEKALSDQLGTTIEPIKTED